TTFSEGDSRRSKRAPKSSVAARGAPRARTVMGTKNSDGSMDEPSFVLQLGFDGSSKPRFDGYGGEKIGPSRVPLGGRRDPEQLLRGTSERDEASFRIEDLGFDVVRARCGALYL